jgi:hypothetical protein
MSLQSWRPWAESVGAKTAEVLVEADIAGGMFEEV